LAIVRYIQHIRVQPLFLLPPTNYRIQNLVKANTFVSDNFPDRMMKCQLPSFLGFWHTDPGEYTLILTYVNSSTLRVEERDVSETEVATYQPKELHISDDRHVKCYLS
jgi:hypothetical protein